MQQLASVTRLAGKGDWLGRADNQLMWEGLDFLGLLFPPFFITRIGFFFSLVLKRLCKTGLVMNAWLCAVIMMYFLQKKKRKWALSVTQNNRCRSVLTLSVSRHRDRSHDLKERSGRGGMWGGVRDIDLLLEFV